MGEPETSSFTDPGGVRVHLYRWEPAGEARAAVHLAHGMGEHARRYDRVAAVLTGAGYEVWADDHRASGATGAEGSGLGDLGPGGMEGAVESLHAVVAHVAATRPDLPVHLVAHSWGSFMAQRIADRWGEELGGLVLSGSTLLAGEHLPAEDLNERFAPARTPYDWLSRDPDEVRKYLGDPWCGLEVAFDVAEMAHLVGPPADSVPPGLPILVINGTDDPVGGFNGGGAALADAYRELGVADVTYRGYEGGRHELFNETNRDEVLADLVAWLEAHSPR